LEGNGVTGSLDALDDIYANLFTSALELVLVVLDHAYPAQVRGSAIAAQRPGSEVDINTSDSRALKKGIVRKVTLGREIG
jgi:hypothetical protein